MLSGRQYVLIIAGIVAMALGLTGSMTYPLSSEDVSNILLYEMLVASGIIGILALINNRGLEED